jgi:hypothetical protein
MSQLPEEIIISDYDNFVIAPKSHSKGSNLNDLDIEILIDILCQDNPKLPPKNKKYELLINMLDNISNMYYVDRNKIIWRVLNKKRKRYIIKKFKRTIF